MINNGVTSENLLRTLPGALADDENTLALASALADELAALWQLTDIARIYSRIDELPETLLDILAYDFKVDWYDYDAPLEVKRRIFKSAKQVHKRLGTKQAVESVVTAYFGSGEVREWFEYGGEPHHFKILSGNPSITDERAEQFFRILDIVKRKSSWLESILITLTGESPLWLGVIHREYSRETHTMILRDIP